MPVTDRNVFRVIRPKCRMCGQYRHADEFIGGNAAGRICTHCVQWMMLQQQFLLGRAPVPHGCDECRKTYAELETTALNGDVLFALVPDQQGGALLWLCLACDEKKLRRENIAHH